MPRFVRWTSSFKGDGKHDALVLRLGTLEMVRASCMFGNSMTLPLVFMGSLLVGPPGERAVGYLALYQMAWSPLLWALAPRVVLRPSGRHAFSLPSFYFC